MPRSLSALLAAAAVAMTTTSATTFDLSSGSDSVQQVVATVQAQGSDTSASSESATVAAASASTSSSDSSTHVAYSIRNGDTSSKGVNLGSWLVAEYWMTSTADIWTGAANASQGEYTAIAQASDPDAIRSHLEYHHSTFINESDIADIAAVGINTVRVPIGFWIVGFDHNDPSGKAEWKVYTNGTLKYLDALVTDWAKKYNVAVLLSVHAVKGSQNGADNSSPTVYGSEFWGSYAENVNNTISMVSFLAERYKDEDAFLGFGLLNEPNGDTSTDVLYDYYERAYAAIRATGSECVLTVAPLLSQQSPSVLTDFMLAPAYTNVWVEWHPYFVWGYDDVSDEELVNTSVKVNFQNSVSTWNSVSGHNRLFIGEWCFATNGKFENDQDLFYEFAQAETDVVNQAGGGWTYWSWRIYEDETGDNMWSLRAVLRDEKLKQILFPSSSGSSSTVTTTTTSNSGGQELQQVSSTGSSTSVDQTQQQTTTTSSSTSAEQTQQQSRKL
ncbi:Glucan 1,3-beta-glucosidase [Phytophthora cinnamomi]|uniref:Glucan 1,3-beta-glucosidase n=1 Tax=Phytophthora cinnamomi TaxID=4785 RepID=UPI003559755F|nr:Glucan 1,3-beta-glucosidase [Phytophthora cinnamomi]